MTLEWSLVIAGYIDYIEYGASISELNSGTDLWAAVQPEETEGGSRGGVGQTDCTVELNQLCDVWGYHNIGNTHCEWKTVFLHLTTFFGQ